MNLNAAFNALAYMHISYCSAVNAFEKVISEQKSISREIHKAAKRATRERYNQPSHYHPPIDDDDFLASRIESFMSDATLDKKDILNTHVARLRSELTKLNTLRQDLMDLRARVDKRGFGIFKCGDVKQRMDGILSLRMLDDVRNDIQSCLEAYSDVYLQFRGCGFPSIQPILNWHEHYERNRALMQNGVMANSGRHEYEVIMSL
ncbi:hypothetical protein Lgee_1568 [Legionella geestiana]|uniref:Uncharacterized protein n=1 Tax=Legionella geestiana TaxID=45065 RepID=A0A0W0TSX7_9GAMM|nr:hypothetical protein [Legionella geestiana]KTC98491.1 hypothetical protein Lgee_1568 [Legionella geestiana]QBS13104.1 hypothetical protein E4T54_10350 [Legionella geestiana]QDQ39214.1 hypothetical protein E3226_001705 [Legionella geestiana]STX54380.1 Uncharacterised protein [Legionella geestiana]